MDSDVLIGMAGTAVAVLACIAIIWMDYHDRKNDGGMT